MRILSFCKYVGRMVVAGLALAFVVVAWQPALIGGSPAGASGATPGGPAGTVQVSYAGAVASAAPAVVNVYTATLAGTGTGALFNDPLFQRFFGDAVPGTPPRRLVSSLGSGVMLSAEGYVLTNHHVIRGADAVRVALRDGREADAIVVGTDPDTDLAVLKVHLLHPPTIRVGERGPLQVGDVVLAIGNPFGVGQTVTMGIVSATGRNRLGLSTFEDFIQTDAAINPGNSGGALVNAFGELVGINSAIASRTGGAQGIGFAIPTSLALEVMSEIIANGHVARGWLGVEIQRLDEEQASHMNLAQTPGVLVAGLVPDAPGDRAGLLLGDYITHVDGVSIANARDAVDAIASVKPGQAVALKLLRAGRPIALVATLGQRPYQRPG